MEFFTQKVSVLKVLVMVLGTGNYKSEIKRHNHLIKIMKAQLYNLTDRIKDYLKDLTHQFK